MRAGERRSTYQTLALLLGAAFVGYLCLEHAGHGLLALSSLPEFSSLPPKHVAATRIADGQLLYRDHIQSHGWVYHYPPVFLYTLGGLYALFGPHPIIAHTLLALATILCGAIVFRLADALHARRTAWLATGVFLLNPITILGAYGNYFDAFVVLFPLLALHELLRGRATTSGALLALGVMSKPFPAVLLPPILAYCLHSNTLNLRRVLFGFTAVVGVVSAPFLLLAPEAYFQYTVLFNFERPTASLSLYYYYLPWLEHTPATILLPGGFVLAVSALLARRRDVQPATLIHGAATVFLGFLLLNRINYPHYLVYVAPFLSILLAAAYHSTQTVFGAHSWTILIGEIAGVLAGAAVWSVPWLYGVERIDTALFAFKSSPYFWYGSALYFVAGFVLLLTLCMITFCRR